MTFRKLFVAALLLPSLALAQEPPPPPPTYPPAPPVAPANPVYPAEPVYRAPPPAPPPQLRTMGGHHRDTWYIGFGLGTGSGDLSGQGNTVSFKEWAGNGSPTNVSLNFKIGATITPKLLLGLDISAVRSATDANGLTTAVQVTNYDAMATWFPMEEGLFLRGGLGLAALSLEVDAPGFGAASLHTNGVSALVGGGYAIWLGQKFNLTANLDYSIQSYGSSSDKPESSSMWNLWVGFDWY